MIAFYKIHYNFAALGLLLLIWAFFLLLRGNIRWTTIILVALLAYGFGMRHAIETNPEWFDDMSTRLKSFEFVNYIWGGSAVSSQNAASIDHGNTSN